MGQSFLKVAGLETGYGQKQILHGIDLEVQANDVVAIVGHNGAGKSTLLKAVFGLIPVWKGSVHYDGRDATGSTPAENVRNGLAYVPQGNRVFGELSVRENLEMGAYTLDGRSEVEKKIEEVYRVFPILKQRENQFAGSLSGGEKQMLALANILVLSPKLLLLDEPSLGLSPPLVKDAFQKIADLNRTFGTTVVIVEQKVREVLRISQRTYLLKMGKVVYEGSSAALLDGDRIREIFL